MAPRAGQVLSIPKDGDVDPNDLTTRKGRCEICDKDCGDLKRHYLQVHRPDLYKTLQTTIPKDGKIRTAQLKAKVGGYCEICAGHKPKIRDHFLQIHYRKGNLKEIPKNGDVLPVQLVNFKGFCKICNSGTVYLRLHFVKKHLIMDDEERKKDEVVIEVLKRFGNRCKTCEICNVTVSRDNYNAHLKNHDGPARCPICNSIHASYGAAQKHLTTIHKGVEGFKSIMLTAEEAKRHKAKKPKYKQLEKTRQFLTGMERRLQLYEAKLFTEKDPLFVRAAKLKTTFLNMIDVAPGADVNANASFVSIWNETQEIPGIIMEVIEKKLLSQSYYGQTFFRDPKIRQPQKQKADFKGFVRGHCVAAANFQDPLLVASTYYYTNIAAMTEELNGLTRVALEKNLRQLAESHGKVMVFHLPIMDNAVQSRSSTVSVPTKVGTIAMYRQNEAQAIVGWELHNSTVQYKLDKYVCDPFQLFRKAGYDFKLSPSGFDFVSKDTPLTK